MRLALAADHAGFPLKARLAERLRGQGHEVLDLGAADATPSDWPDFAAGVAEAVLAGRAQRGVVVCGSGVGACVAANKFPGIRAAICPDLYTARQSVEHDDVNVLCLGARTMKEEEAEKILSEWLAARFTGEARHVRRLAKLAAIEKRFLKGP